MGHADALLELMPDKERGLISGRPIAQYYRHRQVFLRVPAGRAACWEVSPSRVPSRGAD